MKALPTLADFTPEEIAMARAWYDERRASMVDEPASSIRGQIRDTSFIYTFDDLMLRDPYYAAITIKFGLNVLARLGKFPPLPANLVDAREKMMNAARAAHAAGVPPCPNVRHALSDNDQ